MPTKSRASPASPASPASGNPHAAALLRKVRARKATICVVGLGYVGLPTAVAFAKAGFPVIGADLSQKKVAALQKGVSPLTDLGLDADVAATVRSGHLTATTDVVQACGASDVVLLIVPTPVLPSKQPDLSYVATASASAAKGLRKGQLVILESTTYPGTTEDYVITACEKESGLTAGKDFGVGYCPERYNPGDPNHTLANVVRVVGAIGPEWTEVCAALYGTLNGGKITRVRDLRTAEAAKVIENIQRDLNIALVNELALIFERLDIDVHEVLDAAATKWNFVKYTPGPGVGGHCLPVDPYYLTSLAERLGYSPRVILAGRAVNDHMPLHTVGLLTQALNEAGRPVKGSKVAVLGLSYKANTGDVRESPAETVVRELQRLGADLRLCDPYIDTEEVQHHFGLPNVPLKAALKGAHAIAIVTDHDEFRRLDLKDVASGAAKPCALIDTRNVVAPAAARQAGFIYRGIGRRKTE
ncbi:MAG TPA: nucleotide sugar dehydrogenase [Candidatus Thermoplasmatota archaeon]|nr:nucleotide sugar dehydrogenase [Candidatus Thermoplasmatota archaeon]